MPLLPDAEAVHAEVRGQLHVGLAVAHHRRLRRGSSHRRRDSRAAGPCPACACPVPRARNCGRSGLHETGYPGTPVSAAANPGGRGNRPPGTPGCRAHPDCSPSPARSLPQRSAAMPRPRPASESSFSKLSSCSSAGSTTRQPSRSTNSSLRFMPAPRCDSRHPRVAKPAATHAARRARHRSPRAFRQSCAARRPAWDNA